MKRARVVKAKKTKAKTMKQVVAELETMRRWLWTLEETWTGEAAFLQMLVYTNKRDLTEREDAWAAVMRRAAGEVRRVLDEAPERSREEVAA